MEEGPVAAALEGWAVWAVEVSAEAEQAGQAPSPPGPRLGGRDRLRGGVQPGMPLVQAGPHVVGGVGPALPLVAGEHRPTGRDAGQAGQPEQLPEAHGP